MAEGTPRRWIELLIIPLIVGLIIVIVELLLPQISKILGRSQPVVTITYPSDGASVEIREMMRGTSERIPEGQLLWIVVYSQMAGRYYPQNDVGAVQANGDWSSLAVIGIEEDVGRRFDILVVLADKGAQDAFNAYLAQAKDQKNWFGLERLPKGAVIYGRITVRRPDMVRPGYEGDLRVTFIDVGQGDAAWIKTPDGQDILIDGGKEAQGPDLVSYLQGQGVSDIEVLILSHPHADHVGGLVTVLQNMDVDQALTNCQAYSSTIYQTFQDLLTSKGIPTTCVRDGYTSTWGTVSAAAVNPPEPLMSGTGADLNNNSVTLRISYNAVDFLFTGDIKSEAETVILARGPNIEAEVLKVALHGSNSSSTVSFLSQVDPEVAIISVSASNPYGHPHADTLQRLGDAGATIHRTDEDGTIVVTTDGTKYSLQVEDAAIGTVTAPPTATAIATGTPSPGRNLPFWQTAPELVGPLAQGAMVCLGTVLAALLGLIGTLLTLRWMRRSSSTKEDN